METDIPLLNSKIKTTVPKVVVIGGGTGTFVALSGLKEYPLDLHAVITMMDSGGSTGRLRDQLGVLPPGDLRQALVALSASEKIWRDLFVYRFEEGDLEGHNFGNIFISALEKITGSLNDAIDLAAYILDSKGSVVPVTTTQAQLCVELASGEILEGETIIDEAEDVRPRIQRVYLSPEAHANPKAMRTIKQADYIIIGPGDIYTSIIPNFLVAGIQSSIKRSNAKIIYITNLMSKMGQTTGYKASDHVSEIERYLGKDIDYVLVNNKKPRKKVLNWYDTMSKEHLIEDDLHSEQNVIRTDLLSSMTHHKSKSDKIKRSFIRHSPEKLAQVLIDIIVN